MYNWILSRGGNGYTVIIMKKIRRILSVLIAVIFVVGCFSMSAGAESAFAQGFYEGSRYHATNEAYYEFFCATFECRVKLPKRIDSMLIFDYCDGTKDVTETYSTCGSSGWFLYDIVNAPSGYYCEGHAGSSFKIDYIEIEGLICYFDEAFIIPEESDD